MAQRHLWPFLIRPMNKISPARTSTRLVFLALLAAGLAAGPAQAAKYGIHSPVTPKQRATAEQVAGAGVPLSELAPDAPDEYTVRRGDTLWDISGKFLRSPWRWPELWGMNLQDIRNPHLIYPGQQLWLERIGDRARLRVRRPGDGEVGATVRVSPRNRVEMLDANPLPTLQTHLIEPFLAEPLVVDQATFENAPRIVAQANQSRVLIVQGDRAYARGPEGKPLLMTPGAPRAFRVFRGATPLKDPVSGEILGYEGQYVGKVDLVRGESHTDELLEDTAAAPAMTESDFSADPMRARSEAPAKEPVYVPIPATVDVVGTKEEIRAGDRLLPEPEKGWRNYVPHAPGMPVDARVVSVYGNAVRFAGNNQVVAINKGARDGMEVGHVLALQSSGPRMTDKTDSKRTTIQLPDERNGLGMVFLVFDRVAYVLVMQVSEAVQVGDKLNNPK